MMNALEAAARNYEVQLIKSRNLYKELYEIAPSRCALDEAKRLRSSSVPTCKPEDRGALPHTKAFKKFRHNNRVALGISTPCHNAMREYLRGERD